MGYSINCGVDQFSWWSGGIYKKYLDGGGKYIDFSLPDEITSEEFILKLEEFLGKVEAEPLYPKIQEMEKNAPHLAVDIWGNVYKPSSLKWEDLGEEMSHFNIQVARLKYMRDYANKHIEKAKKTPGEIWDNEG